MLFLYLETHDAMCVLIPSLSIGHHGCECCQEKTWFLTLDFLVWSIGIGWASH
jgi:hypothetical protein